MRILQVVNLFGARHGGSVRAVYCLSKELAGRGHQVDIYTSDYKLGTLPISGITVHPFKTWVHLAGFSVTPSMLTADYHFDIIHMHNYRTFQNVVAHCYAVKHKIPYILQGHGSLTTFFYKGKLKRAFDKFWGYRLLHDASKVIAVTEVEAEQCREMGVDREKIVVVPNGVDLAEFENLPKRGEFRKKYGLTNQRVVLYLGRIHEIKGLDLLVEAFASLLNELDAVELVIVGPDDGYLLPLKKLIAHLGIKSKVLFTGPLDGQEKLEAYTDADVFVMPSRYEAFSISMLEACACGVPVVTSDCCGIAETIVASRAGLVVPRDKQLLTDAILNVLQDDKARQTFGGRGGLLVREKFNWQMIVGQVEGIYESVIAGGHSY